MHYCVLPLVKIYVKENLEEKRKFLVIRLIWASAEITM